MHDVLICHERTIKIARGGTCLGSYKRFNKRNILINFRSCTLTLNKKYLVGEKSQKYVFFAFVGLDK